LRRNRDKEGHYRADTTVGMAASRQKRIIPSKITELVKDKKRKNWNYFGVQNKYQVN